MKKIILAALLAAVSTMVGAEIRQIGEKTHVDPWYKRVITSYFDTVSEQYCLVVFEATSQNSLLHCKSLNELSEQAQRNILGDAYVPKSGVDACDASMDSCPKN
ncbi:hypothetical protein [Endozoicomonas sp. SESOKO2]|uniref:hypothetical protein n=1 Tax=Endozoicomonas sp. SESOKO2 TaxID=2828743 RepID=UPI002147E36C|nr:hypothetical protein [Endozoicomonas sp. SESOKO2]